MDTRVVENSICGVVILYNPIVEHVNNIKTYIGGIERLYVIDNSDNTNALVMEKLSIYQNIEYIKMERNRGISYSINFVLNHLKETRWLLTMDQDSYFYKDTIDEYIKWASNLERKIYAITPNIQSLVTFKGEKVMGNMFSEIEGWGITSGMLLNVKIAKSLGGFDENLFIDLVDAEYCFRARKNKFRLLRNNHVILIHCLGDINPTVVKKINALYIKRYIPYIVLKTIEKIHSSHAAIRWYYISRNTFYLMEKYPCKKSFLFLNLIRQIVMLILFEKEKIRKIGFVAQGIKDFKDKKYGIKQEIKSTYINE